MFDWREDCFICAEKCSPKHRSTWSIVEHPTANKPGSDTMYQKMILAAEKRADFGMLDRLYGVVDGDLAAVEARYHRNKGCYTHYISDRHITSSTDTKHDVDPYKATVNAVLEEVKYSLFYAKQVSTLRTLLERFRELAPTNGIEKPCAYKSHNLKTQIMKQCPTIAFISQPGTSDIVCSAEITVGDALAQVAQLNRSIEEREQPMITPASPDERADDESVVRAAIGILRRRMLAMKTPPNDTYCSPDDISIELLKESVEPLLYKAIGWLTNKGLFDAGLDISENDNIRCLSIASDIMSLANNRFLPKHCSPDDISIELLNESVEPLLYKAIGWLTNKGLFDAGLDISENDNIRCLSIASDIMSLANNRFLPKHICLAVHLHHELGSRKLIDRLYLLGHCASYPEIRRFLTSAAVHVSESQTTSTGCLVPQELQTKGQGICIYSICIIVHIDIDSPS